jgi:anti-sigma regulatory factor (Ser/Thr protein kinase)
MSSGFALALRGGAKSAALARRAIAAEDPRLPPSVQDDVSLLVTELITNAVRHRGARNDLTLHLKLVPAGTCVWFELPAALTA